MSTGQETLAAPNSNADGQAKKRSKSVDVGPRTSGEGRKRSTPDEGLGVPTNGSATPDDAQPRSPDGPPQLRLPPNGPGQQPMMRMQNRSTPSLPSQGAAPGQVPPVPYIIPPNYDPATTELGYGMAAMNLGDPSGLNAPPYTAADPIPRPGSAYSYNNAYDPIPRTGTSMSMGSQRRMGPPPRHATTLPPPGGWGPHYGGPPPGQGPRGPPPPMAGPGPYGDTASVYSMDGPGSRSQFQPSRNSGYEASDGTQDPSVDSDQTSIHPGEGRPMQPQSPMNGYYNNYPPPPPHMAGPYPPGGPPLPPGVQAYRQGPPPRGPPPPQIYPQEYNPLYAAATDVLGLGPPPGAEPYPPPGARPPPPGGPGPYMGGPPGPYFPPPQGGLAPPGSQGPYGMNGGGLPRGPTSSSTLQSSDSGGSSRPGLQRAPTTVSNLSSLSTKKTKAIDVNSPPYTKEYVDQYRNRLKGDPDPETHFAYAKYLIEAAKKIGADAPASEQRNVRKYRDSLIQEALKVLRKIATQGEAYPDAQFFLANCYGTGMLGLQVDHERAYHLYYQAAKQNQASACYRVAVCNEIAAGTKKDPKRAVAFYQKAASLGDTAAMYKLGTILLNGSLGEAPNVREGIQWLKHAAEQADEENPHALYTLAMLHERRDNGAVVYDEAYAKDLYTKAGMLGHVPSQLRLGACYEYGSLTCPQDPRRSIAWYTKAAEKGDSEAELSLSGWYLTGSEGVLKQSDSEAYLWARRAANKGLPKAEFAVGYYAEVGIGVKQDMDLAKRWYMRAAAQGNKRAMHRLTELKREGNKKTSAARPTRQQAAEEGCVIM